MDWIESLSALFKENTLLATLIGVGGAGIVTFWVKDVPKWILQALRRALTTQLVLTSSNYMFQVLIQWLSATYATRRFRTLRIHSLGWGSEAQTIMSLGYGNHLIRYHGSIIHASLVKDTENHTSMDRDYIVITKLGRSRKLFDTLLKELSAYEYVDSRFTNVYNFNDGWFLLRKRLKRSMSSIFIEEYSREYLLGAIRKFRISEQWYLDNGIPYQLGILLYGPPGTGKTSLIAALAAHFNYPIYYLSAGNLHKLSTAMFGLPSRCLLVIEDIDRNTLTNSGEAPKVPVGFSQTNSDLVEFVGAKVSDILNAMDGLFSSHGRILIITTNHVHKLDSALLRPGRIDLRFELGYVTLEVLAMFLKRLCPDDEYSLNDRTIRNGITVAELQNMVQVGDNAQTIINKVTEGVL